MPKNTDRIRHFFSQKYEEIDPDVKDFVSERTQPIRDRTAPLRSRISKTVRVNVENRQAVGRDRVYGGIRHGVGSFTRELLGIKKKVKK